ncbi:MAG: hypothetical protein ACLFRD_08755 [Nitriliruptoraceae bacterium]
MSTIRSWGPRRRGAAIAGAAAVALAIGLPTVMIPNPIFSRMIPVQWWNYPVWIATAALSGLLLATYVREGDAAAVDDRPSRRGGLGGVLAYFAVGCPVCNKLVVIALGTSGAMSWFAPLQPILAVGALALLVVALRGRLRGQAACAVPGSLGQPAGMLRVEGSDRTPDDDA